MSTLDRVRQAINFWLITTVWYFLILAFGWIFADLEVPILEINGFWIYFVLVVIYTLTSFREQPAKKLGVKFFFSSRPIQQTNDGPAFVPWPIFTFLTHLDKPPKQRQYPGEIDAIFHGDERTEPLPPGKVLPFRVTTGSPKESKEDWRISKGLPESERENGYPNYPYKNDPLDLRMTLEPSATATRRILDAVQYIRAVGDDEEADRRMRDATEGVITSNFVRRTPARILGELDQINGELEKAIQKVVAYGRKFRVISGHPQGGEWESDLDERWGVDASSIQMVRTGIPKEVSEALRTIAAEKAGVETAKHKADQVRETGKGEGDKEKAVRTGIGEGDAAAAEAFVDKLAQMTGRTKAEIFEAFVQLGISKNVEHLNLFDINNILSGLTRVLPRRIEL